MTKSNVIAFPKKSAPILGTITNHIAAFGAGVILGWLLTTFLFA